MFKTFKTLVVGFAGVSLIGLPVVAFAGLAFWMAPVVGLGLVAVIVNQ